MYWSIFQIFLSRSIPVFVSSSSASNFACLVALSIAAYFEIQKTDAGAYTIEAVKGYKGEKTLTVQTDDGKQYTLTLTGKEECYYIAFGLYLEDGDELLFQSGLVAPGLYVQKMEMTRALAPGEYPAYVVCQPYLSDRTTKTNSGIVKLTLTVG